MTEQTHPGLEERGGPADGGEADRSTRIPTPGGVSRQLGELRLGRFSGLFIFCIVFATFSIWVPGTFLTAVTFRTIAGTEAITGILAISLLFMLSSGSYDLSAAQNVGFSALLCASLMYRTHWSPLEAVVATLAVGALIGVFNGLLIAWIQIDSFIATLGTSSLLLAGAEIVGNGQYLGPLPTSFVNATAHTPLGIPIVTLYLVVIALVAWYVLEHTPVGRRIHASGANRDAARLAGVPTTRYVFICCVATAVGASIAGILLASQLGSVNQTAGPSYLLPAFAAAFLGTTQLKPGRFNVWGTLIAIYLLGTGVQGLNLVGGPLWVTDLFNGLALLIAVGSAIVIERRRGRRERANLTLPEDAGEL
jgi:ribose transport system permease protein